MIDDHTQRIDASEVAKGIADEPAYILLKTRFKNKHRLAFSEAIRLSAEVNKIDLKQISQAGEAEQGRVLEIAERAHQAIEKVYVTYATLVIDWNWLDEETDQPLPKPNGNPDVFKEELYEEQITWIREQIQNVYKYRVTEGNARSGDGSLPG